MFKNVLGRLEEGVIALLLTGMTLLVFTEVVLRYGFNVGFIWMEELTLYLAAWLVMLGASWALKEGAHIGVEVFVDLLPTRPKRLVALAATVLCLLYCALFLYGSYGYLERLVSLGIDMEDLPVPRWAAQSILFIGFVLLAFRLIELFVAILRGEATGFKQVNEAEEALAMVRETERAGAGQEIRP